MEVIAAQAKPEWRPEIQLPDNPRDFKIPNYGMQKFGDLFTPRQLVALTTFTDLVQEARAKIKADALIAGMSDDEQGLDTGGKGATAYADAVAVYLAVAVSRISSYWSNITSHDTSREKITSVFARQAIPMVWDFMEGNPFSETSGNFLNSIEAGIKSLKEINASVIGVVGQANASEQNISTNKVISTDPPYYDNIGYADLSDFFYIWLRRSLRPVYPNLFATMAVPKAEELVATPYRHGSKEKAEKFFLDGMTEAMHRLAEQSHPAFPTTIYYAFKQSDTTDVGTGNTGWETFLEAVLRAGFVITGTWPMRTEMKGRALSRSGINALASSIVLVCRQRDTNAATISRREFLRELKQELTEAIEVMIGGTEGISPVAPVDLAQAVIGPGMAIFSKYAAVLEADGSTMTVHNALMMINRTITEGGDDFDADTQFALSWFDEQGWSEGEFGKADVLARAKGTSVTGIADAGVLESGAGKVRLLKWAQYPEDWSPEHDNRTPVWEALHQLIRVLNQHGESAAGNLISRMPERSAAIRQLAYRLYTLCERKGWAEDARAYNELIGAWTAIIAASLDVGHKGEQLTTGQFEV
jgi:putative DNA methylase